MLPEILSRATAMPEVAAKNDQKIEPDHVYLNSPNSLLVVAGGHITLREREREHNAIGVRAVRESGGFTLAQGGDGGRHSHYEMPSAAIATGCVDCVLGVEETADRIAAYIAGFLPL